LKILHFLKKKFLHFFAIEPVKTVASQGPLWTALAECLVSPKSDEGGSGDSAFAWLATALVHIKSGVALRLPHAVQNGLGHA